VRSSEFRDTDSVSIMSETHSPHSDTRVQAATREFDLLRIPLFRGLFTNRACRLTVQIGAGLVFVAIVAYGFVGPPHGEDNFAVVTTWMLWWLLLPFSFILLGRIWCGICPLGAASDAIHKVLPYKRRMPGKFLTKGGVWVAGLSFFLFAWAGTVWHFDDAPRLTAIIFVSLLSAAILFSLVYQRRTWCRYLCPLGIVAALYSMLSLVGLRSDRKVCTERCASKGCYAVQTKKNGCPMFENPSVMNSNRNCNLCGECINNCPRQSMRLLVRHPFSELWDHWQASRGEVFFVMVLMSLVFLEVVRMTELYPKYMKTVIESGVAADYNLILSLSLFGLVALIVVAFMLSSRLSTVLSTKTENSFLTRYAYAYIPIALAGHLGASIQHLVAHGPRAGKVAVNEMVGSANVFNLPAVTHEANYITEPFLKAVQLSILGLGILGSFYACWKIAQRTNEQRALMTAMPHFVIVGGLSVFMLVLFLQPMGLLH